MLITAMRQSGFTEVAECEIGESRHAPLRGLERHGERWNGWINKFETMVFEATVPAEKYVESTKSQEEFAVPLGKGVRH
jgi:hypothetical protein